MLTVCACQTLSLLTISINKLQLNWRLTINVRRQSDKCEQIRR